MAQPKVTIKEQDLSAFVRNSSDMAVGIAIPLIKGSVDTPMLFSGATDFLARATLNNMVSVNMPLSYFSALKLLTSTQILYIARVTSKTAMYGYVGLANDSVVDPATVVAEVKTLHTAGVKSVDTDLVMTAADCPVIIVAENPGEWSSDVALSVIGYKEQVEVTFTTASKIFSYAAGASDSLKFPDGYPVYVDGADSLDSMGYYQVKNVVGGFVLTDRNGVDVVDYTDKVTATVSMSVIPAIKYTSIPGTYALRVHTGSLRRVTETFIVSMQKGRMSEDGSSLYIEDVLRRSTNIRAVVDDFAANKNLKEVITHEKYHVFGGSDGDPVTTGDYIRAISKLNNVREFKVKILDDCGYTSVAYQRKLEEVARTRDDCIATLSSPFELQHNRDNTVLQQVKWANAELNLNSSYATITSPYQLVYDEYNDREIWLPSSIFQTSCMLKTNANYALWYPPAGNKRGIIDSMDSKIHYTDPEADLLYDNSINPIIFEYGRGIKVNGQLTTLRQPSQLRHVHVRMLLNKVKPELKDYLEEYLHDLHDTAVQETIVTKLTSYFNTLVRLKAIERFAVISNDQNNSGNDKNNSRLNVHILLCPKGSIDDIVGVLAITDHEIEFNLVESVLFN